MRELEEENKINTRLKMYVKKTSSSTAYIYYIYIHKQKKK